MTTGLSPFVHLVRDRLPADLICRDCNGTGITSDLWGKHPAFCHRCGGTGSPNIAEAEAHILIDNLKIVTCQYCRGEGLRLGKWSDGLQECWACVGVGVHFVDNEDVLCGLDDLPPHVRDRAERLLSAYKDDLDGKKV